jgi:hypothetical protein
VSNSSRLPTGTMSGSARSRPPGFFNQRLQFRKHGLKFSEMAGERVFGADGFPDPVGPTFTVIDASRDPVIEGVNPDGLLSKFLENAEPRIRKRALEFVGRSLLNAKDPLPEKVSRRL